MTNLEYHNNKLYFQQLIPARRYLVAPEQAEELRLHFSTTNDILGEPFSLT
ncbi:hypothetical protein NY406_02230 [Chlorobaculum sp. MV4-Y]|uniref:hypothetical protein n=1 Tax=Chlorobaculum sp. MV4-Y TaxID=2976335 RepID=UPI0021B07662|nr:hypothetical protein [Chlorobaculum sp. MV4-Y]UWX58112.1 hypothetical protein NY406_02230 [Chlorobaculum sp. MV4-Y]